VNGQHHSSAPPHDWPCRPPVVELELELELELDATLLDPWPVLALALDVEVAPPVEAPP
jgi:hypothetical protein